jgi:hypothetical protein
MGVLVAVYIGHDLAPGDTEWQLYGEYGLREVRLPAEYERLSLLIEDTTGAVESIAIEVTKDNEQ